MPREIAYNYLVAAAEAWPFASDAAFRLPLLELRRQGPAIFDCDTERLSDDLQAWLRPRAGGVSLGILHRICEFTWFPDATNSRSLAEVLVHIANGTLQFDGPRIVLKRDNDYAARLAHARWSSLLLPPDLLIAAAAASNDCKPPGDDVDLSTPSLRQLLREQLVAETHLHLGAAVSFPVLWNTLHASLDRNPPSPTSFDNAPLGGARPFAHFLVAASVARIVQAAFLRRLDRNENQGEFGNDFNANTDNLQKNLVWAWGGDDAIRTLRLALRAVAIGELHPALPRPRLHALLRALRGPRTTREARNLHELLETDPLASWLAPPPGRALPETVFATRAISYLLGAGRNDRSFAQLFWQYQRIRCLTYRYLVQEPGTPGLDWFKRHYDRLKPFRQQLGNVKFETALALQSRGLKLGALEARIGPEYSWTNLRNEIQMTARQAAAFVPPVDTVRPRIALLLHFLKEQHMRGKAGWKMLHANPAQVAHRVRFGAWGYSTLRTAMAIETVLKRYPQSLVVLRGIDIASTELSVPTWPIVPIFHRLRAASQCAATAMHSRYPAWQVEPFRVTCHAGEDYSRLVEGLRRVHELIDFGVLVQGDRIGHGICLGDEVNRLVGCLPRVPQPAEERLNDLLWELDRYAHANFVADAGRLAYANAEASRLARNIYGRRVDLEDLREARRMLHNPRWLMRFGFPFRRDIRPEGTCEELLVQYLCDEQVFRRGQALEEVVANDGELQFLRAAQSWLRRQVAQLEITVESNPSSNVLVGDFVSVEQHPSFRMAPLLENAAMDDSSLLLSINTDDPLTFAVSLADEYAHMYGALLRDGKSSSDALAWLTQRRDQGYQSTFSLPASTDSEILAGLVEPRPPAASSI